MSVFASVSALNAASPAVIESSARSLRDQFRVTSLTLAQGDVAWDACAQALTVLNAWESSGAVSSVLSEYSGAVNSSPAQRDTLAQRCPGSTSVPQSARAAMAYASAHGSCLQSLAKQYDQYSQAAYTAIRQSLGPLLALGARAGAVDQARALLNEAAAVWNAAKARLLVEETARLAETQAAVAEEVAAVGQDVAELAGVVNVVIEYVELPPGVKDELQGTINRIIASRAESVATVKELITRLEDQEKGLRDGTAVVTMEGDDVAPVTGGIGVMPLLALAGGAVWLLRGAR